MPVVAIRLRSLARCWVIAPSVNRGPMTSATLAPTEVWISGLIWYRMSILTWDLEPCFGACILDSQQNTLIEIIYRGVRHSTMGGIFSTHQTNEQEPALEVDYEGPWCQKSRPQVTVFVFLNREANAVLSDQNNCCTRVLCGQDEGEDGRKTGERPCRWVKSVVYSRSDREEEGFLVRTIGQFQDLAEKND